MKTAIVYDRVNKWGGAETVLLALHELFPDAHLFTSVYHPQKAKWAEAFPKIQTSFLNKVSYFRDKHELLGALMPLAFETFDLSTFDLVISVTSEAAKGVITKPPTRHISYCLTPTRYLWSHYDEYFGSPILKLVSMPIINYLKNWERVAANRPDKIIAISTTVQNRIKKYYKRDSHIIYPPVDVDYFAENIEGVSKGNYFLLVGRLTRYKKIDMAIKAFNNLKFPLVIVGKGNDERKLKELSGKNISFKGFIDRSELRKLYKGARALIMPQEEDFGIVAVEALASGIPVIAYSRGGVKDIIRDGETGILFNTQTPKGLFDAVKRFGTMKFDRQNLIKSAKRFSKEKFKKEFLEFINE